MLAGDYQGKKVSLSQIFEGLGKYFNGDMTEDQLCDLEDAVCPTCGSCAGLFTANSMGCVMETLGLTLPGDATIPAVYSSRLTLARETGAQAVEVVRNNWTARKFITEASLRNALTVDAALGCSTNTVLHLLAIANEAGVDLSLGTFNEIADRTPNIVKLAPSGPQHMEDLFRAGGIQAVLNRLDEAKLIEGSAPTISGDDIAGRCKGVAVRDENIHAPRTGLICLENTHNRCGGAVLPAEYMAAVGELARQHGLKVHLDGARLFNAATALGVDVRTLVAECDSVSFCLSKGLAAPVGSVVVGSAAFIHEARRARKVVGGGMRQAGVIAAAGIVALTEMVDRLVEDHAHARRLAEGIVGLPGIRIDPAQVQTNIVIFELDHPVLSPAQLADRLAERGVWLFAIGGKRLRAVTNYHVTSEDVALAVEAFSEILA
jgi:threonine aldolase